MPNAALFGVDTDAEAIAWCTANLPFCQFRRIQPLPPASLPDCSFDLIYAISVLTHLDASYLDAWLPELRRLLKPGGLVALTFHGEAACERLSAYYLPALKHEGVVFCRSDKFRNVFPGWYHTTFHTSDYFCAAVSRSFRVLVHIPGGMGYQDLVIAERLCS